ncbi:MAG: GntR family transcriptional regulator [Pseudomonadota bacterium]
MVKVYQPGSIVDQLYSVLCQEIMDGTLAPGQFLKEQELKERFGTSRAPIREAVRLLAADRLVVINAYKKKYVRKITREDLLEVIPVLASLEGCAAKITAGKTTPQTIGKLIEVNDELKSAYAAKDIGRCIELNFRFHGCYIKDANNEALKQAIRPIIQRTVRLWVSSLYAQKANLFENTIVEHDKIIEAFKNGDANKIEQSAREHVENLLLRAMKFSIFDKQGNFNFAK